MTLTWDAPESDGGRVIDSYESRHSSDGGDNWSDWTEIPDSGPGGMNHSRYRVMMLTNGTTYTLELRAVTTADGDGASAQTTGMPREPGAIAGERLPAQPHLASCRGRRDRDHHGDGGEQDRDCAGERGSRLTVSTMRTAPRTAGDDFTALSETVTFDIANFALVAAGTHWEASKNLMLTITEDDIDEDDETFDDTAGGERRLGEATCRTRGRNHRHHHRQR